MAPKRRTTKRTGNDIAAAAVEPLQHLVDVCSASPPSQWNTDTHLAAAQQLLESTTASPSDAPLIHTIVRQAAEHVPTSPTCLLVARVLLTVLGGGLDCQLLRYGIVRKLLAAGRDASDMAVELHEGVHALLGTGGEVPLSLVSGCAMVLALTKHYALLPSAAPAVLRLLR